MGREPRRRRRFEAGGPDDRRASETYPRVISGGPKGDKVVMLRYRIEVGRDHGVQPGNIVGAIASEGELDGRYIGQIRSFDTFSLVDLPEDMPSDTFRHLQTVRVCGQALRIRLAEALKTDRKPREPGGPGGRPGRKPPKAFKKKLRHKKKRAKKKKGAKRRGKKSPREG